MAEQFDMNIYNIALNNGFYTEPKNDTNSVTTSNLVFVGDSTPNQNLTYLTESYHPENIEYRQFSNNQDE